MKNYSEHIEGLIAKFLSGEISPLEQQTLETWKAESSENLLYFEKSRELFGKIESVKADQEVDIQKAWKKLEAKLDREEAKVLSLKPKFTVYRAAAAIAIVALLSVLTVWIIRTNQTETVQLSSLKNPGLNKLPDGSSVLLHKNSEISYAEGRNKREVKLKGEAYFNVVHDEKQPFTVTVNDIVIKDIGTAFNVKAIEGSPVIEVIVESGEVHFYSKEDEGLRLVKGEKAVYDMNLKKFSKAFIAPDDNSTSYHSKVFRFNETPLSNVIQQLNDVYGLNIQLDNPALGNCKLSVSFNDEKPDAILNIISETLNLEVNRSGDSVVLKGEPCR